jgi:Domain of unknown function (DUF4864)
MRASLRRAAALLPALAALALAALLLPATAPAAPPAPSAEDVQAIRAVIEAQLSAFQREDGPAAFSYAAPSIQQQFGTPEAFMRMVRQGYRPVYRPRQWSFEAMLVQDDDWVQPVLVTALDGRVVVALYSMERQPDASWRVGGVVLLVAKAQGV